MKENIIIRNEEKKGLRNSWEDYKGSFLQFICTRLCRALSCTHNERAWGFSARTGVCYVNIL